MMRMDPAGLPFVAGALAPAVAFTLARRPAWAWPWAALAGFMAFFFRDPERTTPAGRDIVVSPADGRVLHAGLARPEETPPGEWLQVTIFLSPLDVHVNRAPVAGLVRRVDYVPGCFLAAYQPGAGCDNERTEIELDAEGTPVIMRQVVGVLARRIVCRVEAGQSLDIGERFGLMKFGSRMDVFVPPTAELLVQTGDRVRGGETIIARLRR